MMRFATRLRVVKMRVAPLSINMYFVDDLGAMRNTYVLSGCSRQI